MFKIPMEVTTLNNLIGGVGYLVGGCVRDMIIGREPHDYDMTSALTPQEVIEKIGNKTKINPIGIQYGTLQVIVSDGASPIELTTFRADGAYSDGRRPDTVVYAKSIEEDLSRRDFTINAMAIEISTGKIIDPFNGQQDIKDRIIEFVGDADARIKEDALRMLRAVRFVGQLEFFLLSNTTNAIYKNKGLLSNVSQERISEEWFKICLSSKPYWSVDELDFTGLLFEIFPELSPAINCFQNGWHHLSVSDHSTHVFYELNHAFSDLDKNYGRVLAESFRATVENPDQKRRLLTASLLHDIGKPISRTESSDGISHFYGHDEISARIVTEIADRMKWSSEDKRVITNLVAQHMQLHFMLTNIGTNPSKKVMAKFIKTAGTQWKELMMLTIADTKSARGPKSNIEEEVPQLLELFKKIKEYAETTYEPLTVEPLIRGRDLIELGMEPGPKMGILLNRITELAYDGIISTRDEALVQAQQILGEEEND